MMIFVEKGGISLGMFNLLSRSQRIEHFVSTRKGGISEGVFASLNLSRKVADCDNAAKNRELLATALGVVSEKLVFPAQCHSDRVKKVGLQTRTEELVNTDALITDVAGIFIGVLVADCVPVLLYDSKLHVAGVTHAGWRGTVSGITSKTVLSLEENFGSKPGDMMVCIGPSISVKNFEVGEEVMEKAREAFPAQNGFIVPSKQEGKGYFDLWEANRFQLLELGVPAENIELAGICTFDNSDIFFSARKLGNDSGRFGAGIMLKE